MLVAKRALARGASSGDGSSIQPTAASPAMAFDAPSREAQLSDWDALVARQSQSGAVRTSAAPAVPSDCDVLPSARPVASIPRRTPAALSSTSLPASIVFRPPSVTPNDEPTACRLSGLRIKDRRQAASEVERQLARCRTVGMDALSKWQAELEAKGKDALQQDWVVFGVVAMKSDIRSSSRGEKYVIATLCDLRGHLLSCFLFGQAFHQHHREELGSVVAVANAKLLANDSASALHPSAPSSSHSFLSVSLSVSQPSQLLVLGASFDFALCASYKREQLAGSGPSSSSLLRCRSIVDTRKGKFCDFHVREEYKRLAGNRPGINKSFAGELSGLVKFGDGKRGTAPGKGAAGGAADGGKAQRFAGLSAAGFGSGGWTPDVVSAGNVFLMPPLKHAGKTAAVATTVRPSIALKPSNDSARLLAMVQADQSKQQAANSSRPVVAVQVPLTTAPSAATKAPPRTASFARPSHSSPSTPASVAQLRANQAAAAASASALVKTPQAALKLSPAPAAKTLLPPSDNNPSAAVQRPKPPSREETTRELRRLHALQALAKHGPVAAPDPNRSHSDEQHVLRTTASSKRKPDQHSIRVNLTADGGMDVRHLPPSAAVDAPPADAPPSPGRAAKRARLEALFGAMDESSERFKALVSASSAHVALLADMKQDEREQYWQWLESKEDMQRQMEAIREQRVEVWHCADCNGRRTLHFPVLCKDGGHLLDKRPAVKRFFECGQCHGRVTTIDSALPLHCCHKCGAAEWRASGMASERAGIAASVRSELQHKSEETWLKSSSAMDGIKRNDDPNNAQGTVHEDDR